MKNITPQVWYFFEEICRIPRPSKKEEKICAYLREFAQKHNLVFTQDRAGNVVIRKQAATGKENLKTTILQSHLDMVCEKDADVKHNFATDPIDFYIDGDWMKARGTTLGADDGIGVAATLAILSAKNLVHGPLEALFTVDEESGLTGAKALQKDFLKGDILINLDSEDEGELFIGCAGGVDNVATFTYNEDLSPPNTIAFELNIRGMKGGHSGDDIHKRRGNAIKILNHILLDSSSFFGISLCRFEGGNVRNAIPREASAIIVVNKSYEESFMTYCTSEANLWKDVLKSTSPGFQFTIKPHTVPEKVIDIVSQSCLLHSISDCPAGVIAWSEVVPNLVETSSNVASVKFTGKNKIVIATSQRSDNENAKQQLSKRIYDIFDMADANVKTSDGYPGWTPNLQSPVLEITRKAYETLFNQKPVVRAIHAGLECGLFLEKYPHLDMISLGPTIKNVHSPGEQLNIPTVTRFIELLLTVLEKIPEK